METIIQAKYRGDHDRTHRWTHLERAALINQAPGDEA
jgi:hypothetical protein